MARTPNAALTHVEETAAPTVNDDEAAGFEVASRWINESTGQIYYCVDATVGAAVWVNVTPEFIDSAEETTAFVTTSTTFQEFLSLTFTAPLATNYEIRWFYVWSHDSVADDFEARVQLDNTTDLIDPDGTGIHKQEPADSAGGGTGGTDQRHVAAGHRIVALTQGSHDVDLDFRTADAGDESTIYHAVISVRRAD